MKEPAKNVGIVRGGVGSPVPPRTGLLVLIGEGIGRLSRRESRAATEEDLQRLEEGGGRDARTSRSALDAGITGGMTFLFSGSGRGRSRGR